MRIIKDYEPYWKEIQNLEKTFLTGSLAEISSNSHVLVAIADEKFLGYLYYEVVLDEAEIISICIVPEARKKGIASELWHSLIADFQIEHCFLDVKESNEPAKSFYKKMGFLEYGRRKKYYRDGSDAILMKWSR